MTRLLVICIVALAASAICYSWTTSVVDESEEPVVSLPADQQAIVDELFEVEGVTMRRSGGEVITIHGGGSIDDRLAARVGKLTSLRSLHLESCPITEEGLAQLAGLDNLESLWLDGVNLTARGSASLQDLESLRELSLAGCELDSETLASIGKLERLESLDVSDTKSTDADLMHISGLSGLKRLYLMNTPVTGSGLTELVACDQIELLNLSGAPVDADIVDALRKMKSLDTLYLDATPVDDAMLSSIVDALVAEAPGIRGLFLDRTNLTDGSIESLSRLSQLENLAAVRIAETEITRSSFEELAASAPEIRFAFGSSAIEAD